MAIAFCDRAALYFQRQKRALPNDATPIYSNYQSHEDIVYPFKAEGRRQKAEVRRS